MEEKNQKKNSFFERLCDNPSLKNLYMDGNCKNGNFYIFVYFSNALATCDKVHIFIYIHTPTHDTCYIRTHTHSYIHETCLCVTFTNEFYREFLYNMSVNSCTCNSKVK